MKDAYYFPHDSNATNDPKIMMMIAQWGLEAYGIFWTIIEHLREQPNYKSHIKIARALAARYGSSEEKYLSIIKSFGLFIVQSDEFFYSKSLNARMKPLKDKREKMKALANKRWSESKETKEDMTHAYALPAHMPTQCVGNASKDKVKIKESRDKVEIKECKDFVDLWQRYPSKDGKKAAYRFFKSSVKTSEDLQDIKTALDNYLQSERVRNGYVKNGSTWFNNWRDWVEYKGETAGETEQQMIDRLKKQYGEET